MFAEGKGLVAPAPITIKLDRPTVEMVLDVSLKQSAKYKRSTGYRAGYIQEELPMPYGLEVPRYAATTLVGNMGEFATLRWALSHYGPRAASLDTRTLSIGDSGWDMVMFDNRVQIKTRRKARPTIYIRRRDNAGRLHPLKWNILVSCQWTGGNAVQLLGWMTDSDARACPVKVSPIPGEEHFNLVCQDRNLLPMSNLMKKLDVDQMRSN